MDLYGTSQVHIPPGGVSDHTCASRSSHSGGNYPRRAQVGRSCRQHRTGMPADPQHNPLKSPPKALWINGLRYSQRRILHGNQLITDRLSTWFCSHLGRSRNRSCLGGNQERSHSGRHCGLGWHTQSDRQGKGRDLHMDLVNTDMTFSLSSSFGS